MGEHQVAELVAHKRVQFGEVAAEVNRPVLTQFLGAQNQHAVVAQLEVFDDGQRRIGFAQADAVGQDAAVVLIDFLYRAFDAIFLKVKQRLPDFRFRDGRVFKKPGCLDLPGQKLFKNMKQGFEVDELGPVVHIELGQIFEHTGFDIFNQRGVVPQLVKPEFEVGPVTVAIYHHVELDVGNAGQPQPPACEVGAAHQRVLALAVVDVIELAVQQVALPDRADFDLAGNPFGAAAGDFFLLQAVGQLKAFVFNLEGFFVCFFWIKRLNEPWFAKKKAQRSNAVELFAQCLICVNGEVGRHYREAASIHQLGT